MERVSVLEEMVLNALRTCEENAQGVLAANVPWHQNTGVGRVPTWRAFRRLQKYYSATSQELLRVSAGRVLPGRHVPRESGNGTPSGAILAGDVESFGVRVLGRK